MSEPLRPPRRARALSFALLAAVFVAGGLAGAAADRVLADRGARDRREHGDRGRHGRHGLEAAVFDRLDLDARQRAEAERIFERRRHEAAAVWDEMKPRLQRILDGTRADLARVLTPEQLADYDRLVAERQRRMDGRFKDDGDREKRKP